MGRRPRNRLELRAEHDRAEALGLNTTPERKPRAEPTERKTRPAPSAARMKVVWAVCDIGGRTVSTFDYAQKADAEALAAQLKARGKGEHFVRSVKEPMG